MNVFWAPSGELPKEASSPEEISRFVVEAAVHAPSVNNTQPWWFSTGDHEVSVHADVERRLRVADPDGREMMISCGAALFTARVALRYLGFVPKVHVLPDPDLPNLVARIGYSGEQTAAGRVRAPALRRDSAPADASRRLRCGAAAVRADLGAARRGVEGEGDPADHGGRRAARRARRRRRGGRLRAAARCRPGAGAVQVGSAAWEPAAGRSPAHRLPGPAGAHGAVFPEPRFRSRPRLGTAAERHGRCAQVGWPGRGADHLGRPAR